MRNLSFAPLTLAAALGASALHAQTPPVFPRGVEVVTVDIVATDKAGNPVTTLTKDDFTVLEEKQPQAIQSFELITTKVPPPQPVVAAAAPPPRPRIATNAGPPPPPGRTFVIAFDNMNLSPLNAQRAKAAVLSFLDKGLREGDQVTLASTGGGAWWTARMPEGRHDLVELLKGLDARKFVEPGFDRLTDFEAMRIYMYSDSQVARRVQERLERYGVANKTETEKERAGKDFVIPGRVDLYVDNRASETYLKVRTRNRATFAALERMLKPLEKSRDRKAMVYVSEGFVYDPAEAGFRRVVEAARRANAAVYFVDTRGLANLPSAYTAEFGSMIEERNMMAALTDTTQDAEGAVTLSNDTGGFAVTSTNDLEAGVVRIGRESSSYYLIGYTPVNVARDGRFRRIEVRVRRPGLVVRARRGYFAPSDTVTAEEDPSKNNTDPQLQFGLDSPISSDGIPLRLTAYVMENVASDRARVLLAADADVSKVEFREVEGKALGTLDTLAVVARRENSEFSRKDEKVDLQRKPGAVSGPSWYTLVREFELPAGGFQAKMVVRDPAGARMGTLTLAFDVPPLAAFRITSPILSDIVQAGPGGAPGVVLLVRREFRVDRPLFCRFDVMNGQKDARQMPKVTAGYVLRRADGTVVNEAPPTEIEPTSLGAVARLMQIPLAGIAPGDYELVLTARDENAKREASTVEPIRLLPAGTR